MSPSAAPRLVINLSDSSSKENAGASSGESSDKAVMGPPRRLAHPTNPSANDEFLGLTSEDIQEVFTSFQAWASPSQATRKPTPRSTRGRRQEREHHPQQNARDEDDDNNSVVDVTREKESGRVKKKKAGRGLLGVLEVCNCSSDSSPLSTMQKMVDEVVRLDEDMSGSREYGEASINSSADDADDNGHELQIRRLTSWGTVQTYETFGTEDSVGTHFTSGTKTVVVDDDGNPIDARLLEKTIEASQKRSKRKRLVKFDYPPVSAFRECPRLAEEDIHKMFFSPEELDQIEEDRVSTSVADDVEVVAVASMIGASPDPSPVAKTSASPPKNVVRSPAKVKPPASPTSPRGLGLNSSTSSKSTMFSYSDSDLANSSRRQKSSTPPSSNNNSASPLVRPPTPPTRTSKAGNSREGSITVVGDSPSWQQRQQPERTPPVKKENKRLVQSVQIFLRERSTGNSRRGDQTDRY